MPFFAGGYTATYDGSDIGQVEDGFDLEETRSWEPVTGDAWGDTVQDGVYRGGNCFLQFTLIEWDSVGLFKLMNYAAAAPAATTAAEGMADMGEVGVVGRMMQGLAKALVLTKRTGPNATPTTLTANKAVLAPNFPPRMLMASRLKRVPIRLQLLPYYVVGTTPPLIWYIMTNP